MEKLIFTRVRLSYIREIMVIMRVSMVELLCQMPMGRILALEYVLSGAWVLVATSHCVRQ
jgi:hypothetical protein